MTKRNLNSSLLWCLCTLLIGGLMIAFPTETSQWLAYGIGVLIIVAGATALFTNLLRPKGEPTNYALLIVAFIGLGGGISFLLNSEANANYLFYVLGILPVLGALTQLLSLIRLHRKEKPLPSIAYVVPIFVALLCITVIVWKEHLAQLPILLLGIAWIIFSLFELLLIFSWAKLRKQELLQKQLEEQATKNLPTEENTTTEEVKSIEVQ